MSRKIGFYRKSSRSNQRLVKLFNELQKDRSQTHWEDANSLYPQRIDWKEKQLRREVLKMLKKGEIRTSDDFYRAAMLFQHRSNFKSYALAVALAAASSHLGEAWGRSLYAMALDRFLLSIGQKQHFGTNFEKVGRNWRLASYNKKTSDYERQFYLVEPMKRILQEIKKLNRTSGR